MRSSAVALLWPLWWRHRRGVTLYLAVFAVIAGILGAAPGLLRPAGIVPALPLLAGLLYLVVIFTLPSEDVGGADVATGKSWYPAFMLRLPVRTWELALWPALAGGAAVAAAWAALARWVLAPLGMDAPAGWPAALLAALLACAQALVWTPLPLRCARIVVAVLALPVLIDLAWAADRSGVPGWLLSGCSLALFALGCAASVAGIRRARTGGGKGAGRRAKGEGWTGRDDSGSSGRRSDVRLPCNQLPSGSGHLRSSAFIPRTPAPAPPLPAQRPTPNAERHPPAPRPSPLALRPSLFPLRPSPFGSQLWFEWRRSGWVLPLLVAAGCLLFTLPLLWIRETEPLAGDAAAAVGVGRIETNVCARALLAALLFPSVFAMVAGGLPRRDGAGLEPFLATRPLATRQIAGAQLLAAGASAAAACGVLFLFVVAWLCLPARDSPASGPLGLLLFRYLSAREVAGVLLIASALLLLTWRMRADAAWASITGLPWLARAYPLVCICLVPAAIVAWEKVTGDPARARAFFDALPFLLAAAAGAKLLAGAAAGVALVRRRVFSAPAMLRLGAGWLVLAGGAAAMLRWVLPAGAAEFRYLLPCVVLFLPLVRLALFPLALASRRNG